MLSGVAQGTGLAECGPTLVLVEANLTGLALFTQEVITWFTNI